MSRQVPHYAVFGRPVAHSLSPQIHAEFGKQCDIPVIYLRHDTGELGLAATLARFASAGGVGANITVPHKTEVLALCKSLGRRAQRAGAVNTLILREGHWHGENTDGIGLVRDIQLRQNLDLYQRRVLLLGAGGAAHGVAPALLEAGIAQMVIANRSRARAVDLLDRLGTTDTLRACTLQELPEMGSFDLIVQATSAGLDGGLPELPPSILTPHSLCIDLNYGRAALPFTSWARSQHCERVADGLGMLVEQAAEAFALWHGIRPDTDPVYNKLRISARL
ncbi:shikimate dehydrogenase [Lysobacteraceae bacterium NML120232]|nr:shikimate dehydrogenase [Xanthomonadaceae bacterium NML120232]